LIAKLGAEGDSCICKVAGPFEEPPQAAKLAQITNEPITQPAFFMLSAITLTGIELDKLTV
jgi:hypothetical protein